MGSRDVSRAEYHRMIQRIREAARTALPSGANVLVVSKGDPALLDLPGPRGLHFPQDEHGGYAGYHPAADSDALMHLEKLRAGGADYLLLPKTAYWWLGHYRGFARYLETHCTRVHTPGDDCRIFALGPQPACPQLSRDVGDREEAQRLSQLVAFLESVLPSDARVAVIGAHNPGALGLGARVVQTLDLPNMAELEDGETPGTGVSELIRQGVDYVVVPKVRSEQDDVDPSLLDNLRRSGRLLAYRRHLGWLFSVMRPPDGPENPCWAKS